jgi:uncharacterized membrane protein YgdD (TMEM256/DUF423 family)
MNQLALIFGSLFGMLAILLGAFGAHLLKNKLTQDQLNSFETGVKYQMYHAVLLLILGFNFKNIAPLEKHIVSAFIIGTMLFSFSIYGLVLSSSKGKKMRFLGPITPLGGLFLTIGWGLLLVYAFRNFS